MNKADCGRLGGLTTFLRYGAGGMAERGRKGGRPNLLSLEELIRQSELQKSKEDIAKEGFGYPGCNDLRQLKKLWRERCGRSAMQKNNGSDCLNEAEAIATREV